MAQNSSQRGDVAPVSSPSDRVDNGWDDAARAIYSVRQIAAPVRIRLQPDDRSPYVVDFQRRIFHSGEGSVEFPTNPVRVTVQTFVAASEDDEPTSSGQNLELLLWDIGRSSFMGGLAPWLSPAAPYRLTAWPDFTGVFHTTFHLRLTAHMANHAVTVNEVIELFQVDAESVHAAVNAFSLLGILEQVAARPSVPAPVDDSAAEAPATGGLWSRLRDRWGF